MPPFDSLQTAFSLNNALYLAQAAQAAYAIDGSAAFVAAWPSFGGIVTPFSDGGTDKDVSGFVAVNDSAVLLVFRGTANLPGWMTDADIIQTPHPADPDFVHFGFANGLKRVWDQIMAALPADPGPERGVWVTGHSLGAALATLAAQQLCRMPNYNVNGTYTFGSPRVGNIDFYHDYKPVNYRFVNNNDIVPHVPLEGLLVPNRDPAALLRHPLEAFLHFTYKHVGTLKYFDRHGRLGEGMSDWEAKKDAVLGSLEAFGQPTPDAIADHAIARYIEAIEKNLNAV